MASYPVILFHKPYGVLSQFQDENGRKTLKDYIEAPHFYPAGRLDKDSEGLLILVNNGKLQHYITSPLSKLAKTYLVQLEGVITEKSLKQLRRGIDLRDGLTQPAIVKRTTNSGVPPRQPPIRVRKSAPTSWAKITITEGRNRQVRRMFAHVGFPVLRLIRLSVGDWQLAGLDQGKFVNTTISLTLEG